MQRQEEEEEEEEETMEVEEDKMEVEGGGEGEDGAGMEEEVIALAYLEQDHTSLSLFGIMNSSQQPLHGTVFFKPGFLEDYSVYLY